MTIIKLTKSNKAIQVVDDYGNVYTTSAAYVLSLITGNLKKDFIYMSRMPYSVSPDRFGKSELWVPPGANGEELKAQLERKEVREKEDAYSHKFLKENTESKQYKGDDNIWN